MLTKISLEKNTKYIIDVNVEGPGPGVGFLALAMFYLVANTGSATVIITDSDGVRKGPFIPSVPGIFASYIRESTNPNHSIVEITSGNNGFQGEINIEMRHYT